MKQKTKLGESFVNMNTQNPVPAML